MSSRAAASGTPWYRHGYVWFVIAVPLSSVIVGTIMFTLATHSYDGLVTDDYYRRGLQINKALDRDRAAEMANLQAEMTLDSGEVKVVLRAGATRFKAPSALRVRLSHATRAGFDQHLTLARVAPGEYQGPANALAAGRWYVEIAADDWRLVDELTPPQSHLLLKAGKT